MQFTPFPVNPDGHDPQRNTVGVVILKVQFTPAKQGGSHITILVQFDNDELPAVLLVPSGHAVGAEEFVGQ